MDIARRARQKLAQRFSYADSKQDVVTMTWRANGRNWRKLRVWIGNGFLYFAQYEYAPGLWLNALPRQYWDGSRPFSEHQKG